MQNIHLAGRGKGSPKPAAQAAAPTGGKGNGRQQQGGGNREKALEQQVAQLKAQLAKANKEPVADESEDPETIAKADLDRRLADITSLIATHKQIWGANGDGDDVNNTYLAKLEATPENLRTKKRLAKPLASRTMQTIHQLENSPLLAQSH